MKNGKKNNKNNFQNKTILIWKMAIASAISWETAKLVGSGHPYLAPLSVVLCLQSTIDRSIRYSFHRIVGTVIGVVLTAYIVSHLEMNGWVLGLLILVGTFIAKWLRLDESVLYQVALTILLIFTFERKSGDYALDRILDTIIGAVIALIFHMFFFPPDYTKQATTHFQTLAKQLSEIFQKISNWVQFDWGKENALEMEYKIKNLLQELHNTNEMLQTASNSLKFNPFGKKHGFLLSIYQTEIQKLNKGYQYVSTIVGTLKEWEREGPLSTSDQREVVEQMKILNNYFGNLQINELQGPKETEQKVLLNTLQIKMQLNLSPSHQLYRESFNLETKKLIKNLS